MVLLDPFLAKVKISRPDNVDGVEYPFCVPIIKNFKKLHFTSRITFFVGENGSGKSTFLEAIALHAGFGFEGGSRNIHFQTGNYGNRQAVERLSDCLQLSWRSKPKNGYFFRAESFFNLANYLDQMAEFAGPEAYKPYGGVSLHAQSHGESFFSFFQHRIRSGGFFILDEPEAALSPQRQLSLLVIMHQLLKNSDTQFLIATHSPILLAFPGAIIYSCDGDALCPMSYTQTAHYQIMKGFLSNPECYLQRLFEE